MNRLREILDARLHKHSPFKEAIEEAREADRLEIERLQDQLDALEAQRVETLPRLAQDLDNAGAELIEARAMLLTAEQRYATAMHASLGASAMFDSRAAHLRGQIRALTDDGAIDAFISRLRREHGELPKTMQSLDCAVTDAEGNERWMTITNAGSIGRRMQAIVGLIRAADEIRFKSVPNLKAALESMYAALPAVEQPSVSPPTLAQKAAAAVKKLDPRQSSLIRRGMAAVEDFVEAR